MLFTLSEREKNDLLNEAHRLTRSLFVAEENPEHSDLAKRLQSLRGGLFASLYVGDELNGCIGKLKSNSPILELLPQMLRSAAFYDYRFPCLKEEDLPALIIELSLISPMVPVHSTQEIIPGRHGVYLRKGTRSGTYLPQVAQTQGWNTLELLRNCSEHKAGIGPQGWKTAEIFTYEALIIKG